MKNEPLSPKLVNSLKATSNLYTFNENKIITSKPSNGKITNSFQKKNSLASSTQITKTKPLNCKIIYHNLSSLSN